MLHPPPLPRKYEACLRDLVSTKAEVRASAASDIVRHARVDDAKRDEAIPLLEKALSDEAPRVRAAAAIALADLKASTGVKALLLRVDDDDPNVRQMAITALGEIGDPKAAARLCRALTDDRPEVRYQAIIAYSRVAEDPDEVGRALAVGTRDDDMNVRYISLRVAEEKGITDARVKDRAVRLLKDEAIDVAIAAAIYLTKSGDERGHPLVLSVVEGRTRAQKEDEREAVEVAGAAGLKAATRDLERRAFGLLSKVRDTSSFHALIALARMGHAKATSAILADLRSPSKKKREAAVVAAGRAKLLEARDMIEAIQDVDADLRDEALAALEA